jgi:hypothetical protein
MAEVMNISDIKVGKRHRKDLGDIDGLAASISDVGLLQPIVVKPDGTLIAGERRRAACSLAGKSEVPVHVVDLDEVARGEFHENVHRKNFLPSEIYSILREVEPIERALAEQRKKAGLKRGDLKPVVENCPHGNGNGNGNGKTRDKIAAWAGISGRTLDKLKAVAEAGEQDPERYGSLVAEMDWTGKIDHCYAELQRARREEQDRVPITEAEACKIITGDFRTAGDVVADNSVDCVFTDLPWAREFNPAIR